MFTRTTHSIVHFDAPFALKGVDKTLPAGDYDVDQDEELIDGLSRAAYCRVATYIHVPARSSKLGTRQVFPIDHFDLEAALLEDQSRPG
ncbi:hypothetical protein ACTJJ7_05385 [Phyllobacterium sp. 22229]|uniref:Uncharacterized protein n=1 Tax=Phyllobacterium myrsinacearum TaxID=28101 RepID=A0A2S9JB47_9HYPH|nr:hypothetical protein [Phyllobacterium myrsinacearum]PRD50026.1 hypothetical protein C5750_22050 [Phyllobacterium myrsinacearum]PWV90941.1 hypothetical protein DEV92_106287 [Phyllobacterium myrsinacearum]RZS88255.1 hypothetical protein EV217_0638 [Phyllobacterium myrsinacearum]RZU97342.1 hypothetical protein EV654_4923 [Phyllobacterium myrsinacearum]